MSQEKRAFWTGLPKSRAELVGAAIGVAISLISLFVWPYPAWPIWRLFE
jgi:hypothetical protein